MDALRHLYDERRGARILEDAVRKEYKAYGKVESLDDDWLENGEV